MPVCPWQTLVVCGLHGSAFNGLLNPDPEGGKSAAPPQKKEEKLSLKTRKNMKINIF
jgi:hypothetical protein